MINLMLSNIKPGVIQNYFFFFMFTIFIYEIGDIHKLSEICRKVTVFKSYGKFDILQ